MAKKINQPSTQQGKKKQNPENTELSGRNSGVGGNRTLVQTSNRRAFYTFSFQLIFELWLTENGPPLTLSPLLESLVGTPKLRC